MGMIESLSLFVWKDARSLTFGTWEHHVTSFPFS
jgi:hypothetical protein